ncbi:MAG TPA: extracellular solute-binding protein, partial [Chloroflexia bacterium]|nr:extracellular solute-binding protein [Chloroflexia bacterium]
MSRKSTRLRLFYCALVLLLLVGCDSGPAATPTPTSGTTGSAPTSTVASPSNTQAAEPGANDAASPTAAGSSLSGEITFLVFGEPSEARAFVEVGKSFEAAYPSIKIKTTAVPSQPDHLMKLATGFAAGEPPDVWVIDYRRFGLLQNAGVVEPAQPYL